LTSGKFAIVIFVINEISGTISGGHFAGKQGINALILAVIKRRTLALLLQHAPD
jgi:hypothetical protein